MALTKIHNRMISNATYQVDDFGAVGDGVADDTSAIQTALDYLRDNRGVLEFDGSKEYKITSPLIITWTGPLRNIDGDIKIRGNGCRIDATSLSGSQIALRLEGSASAPMEAKVNISGIKLSGPESTTIKNDISNATTTTAGMKFEYVWDVTVEDCEIIKFYNGLYFTFCWPIYSYRNIVSFCGRGLFLEDACTIGFHNSQYDENWIGAAIQSETSACHNQTFSSCLFQNSEYGIIIGAAAGRQVYSIILDNPYFENIGGNAINLGYDNSLSSTAGSVYNITVSGGTWSNLTGKAVQCGGGVRLLNMTNIYGIDATTDIGGTYQNAILIPGNASLDTGIYFAPEGSNSLTRFRPISETSILGPGMFVAESAGISGNQYLPSSYFFKRQFMTNGVTTTMWSLAIDDEATYFFEADILMRRNGADDSSVYKIACAAKRDGGGSATLIGSSDVLFHQEDVNNTVSFVVSGNEVRLQSAQGPTGQYASGYVKVLRIYENDWS